jgi:hypothetical protein
MSCDRYATAITDHACGADLAPEAAAHLRACAACAARLTSQRRAIDGLDGELQQLLAVEPSAHFVPRVQAQIAAAPAQHGWSTFLWSGLAAAAAVAIVAVSLTMREPRKAGPVESRPEAPAQAQTTAANPTESVAASRDATAAGPGPSEIAPRRRTRPAPARAVDVPPQPEPEVLVPAGQLRAVERYMALMRSGRLDTSRLEAKASVDPIPAELVLGALEIDPMTVRDIDASTPSAVERRHEQE